MSMKRCAHRGVLADMGEHRTNHRPYSKIVVRSLITLKALTYAPHGGIIAAPTTSLPEQIGRIAQLGLSVLLAARRDADTASLMNAGYYDEARAWRDWLLRAAAGSPAADPNHVWGHRQAMAGRMGGAVALRLRGLEAGAHRQRRLRSTPARCLRRSDGRAAPWRVSVASISRRGLGFQRALLATSRRSGRCPDDGIWEVRGERRHFTHSKVMAWVAFDRAIKSAETFGLDGTDRSLARAPCRDPRGGLRRAFNRKALAHLFRPTRSTSWTRARC